MIGKLLSRAFGAGGASAERMTGYIARIYYVLGLAGAIVWLMFISHSPLPFFHVDRGFLPISSNLDNFQLWVVEVVEKISSDLDFPLLFVEAVEAILSNLDNFLFFGAGAFFVGCVFILITRRWGLVRECSVGGKVLVVLGIIPCSLPVYVAVFVVVFLGLLALLVTMGFAATSEQDISFFSVFSSVFFRLFGSEFTFWSTLFTVGLVFLVPLLMLTVPTYWMILWEYIKETDWWRDAFVHGKGGSARWGGIRAFMKHDIGEFFGGNANTGAGKSRDAIWNTLLSWCGGVFVFDPKGEHTRVTLYRRSAYAEAYVIDPYHEVKDIVQGVHYNPLDEIDPDSPAARDQLRNVAEASIYMEKGEGANAAHFRENAQTIFRGFLAHVKTAYPPEQQTLPTVYNLLNTGRPEGGVATQEAYDALYKAMSRNLAIDGSARDAVGLLQKVSTKEQGSYLSTITRGIDWINAGPVREVLSKSGPFKMSDLKAKETTVYFVLPEMYIVPQMRFIRTLGALLLDTCNNHVTPQPQGSERRVLALFDEFKQLGHFQPVVRGLLTGRSSYVKLWLIVQNLGQIFEHYENPDDFLGSCDLQFFGLDSMDTKSPQLISSAFGEWIDKNYEGRKGEAKYHEYTRSLLTPSEVAEKLDPDNPLQIVIPKKGKPLKLTRVPYYKNYKPLQYGDRNKHEHFQPGGVYYLLIHLPKTLRQPAFKDKVVFVWFLSFLGLFITFLFLILFDIPGWVPSLCLAIFIVSLALGMFLGWLEGKYKEYNEKPRVIQQRKREQEKAK